MEKIRIEYETLDRENIGIRYLTSEQVVEAFIEEFSDKEKTEEEIVVDIFKATDPTADAITIPVIESAVIKLKKRGSYSITSLVEKVLAPANKLAQADKEVLKKYCQGLDNLHQPKIELTSDEVVILKNIDKRYKYIARDNRSNNGPLTVFEKDPEKNNHNEYVPRGQGGWEYLTPFYHLFQNITFESGAHLIADLIKENEK